MPVNFTPDVILQVLVIIVVAVVLIWAVGAFVPALGLPAVVVPLLNAIIGIGALIAIARAVGLLA